MYGFSSFNNIFVRQVVYTFSTCCSGIDYTSCFRYVYLVYGSMIRAAVMLDSFLDVQSMTEIILAAFLVKLNFHSASS